MGINTKREAILMSINEAELNAAGLQQAETKSNRIRTLNGTGRDIFNEPDVTNKLHYRHNQGSRDIYESFAKYIYDFYDDVKMPLENHPFVQAQQQQFRNEIANFETRFCYIFQERFPTKQNIHMIEKYPPN